MNWLNKISNLFSGQKNFAVIGSTSGLYANGFKGGKASKSPTLAACRNFITQGINEAPLIFQKETKDGWEPTPVPSQFAFIVANLIQGGIVQQTNAARMAGASWDLATAKNCLFQIIKNESGKEIALEYIPWSAVNPDFGGTNNILKGYRVTNGGRGQLLNADEVIHIRLGLDESVPCLGDSNEMALRDAVCADADASRYSARVLNTPAPGMIANFVDETLSTPDNRQALKENILRATSGENAGGIVVTDADVKIAHLGFTPEDMAIDKLAKQPQYAICSILGIPVQALSVSAASESSTYANVAEARKTAATNVLIPIWNAIEQAFNERFFGGLNIRVNFDTRGVIALQPDMKLMAERAEKLYRGGVIDRATAKQMVEVDYDTEDIGHYASEDKLASPIGNNEAQKLRDMVGA